MAKRRRAGRSLRGSIVLAAALAVSIVLSAGAHAAPGDLDPTFSGDGKQLTDFGGGRSAAAATVRQPDGKIVVVGGTASEFGEGNFALARYNRDGSLDPSFSGDGKQTTDFGGDDGAAGVAIQGNGKLVVVGNTIGNSDFNFALARYNPNGSLDTSFSGDGRQRTDFGGDDVAAEVALQGNGNIVAVGNTDFNNFALARYNPNGSLDRSFSGDGKQRTDFGGNDGATGVALQGNGKIVVVGGAGSDPNGNFALARYKPDGTLDASFSGDGKQTTNFGGDDAATGVALQGDGRIVAVGSTMDNSDFNIDFALARYNPNGSLDASFSGDGRQTTEFGANDGGFALALQGDGKIIAVGRGRSVGGANVNFAIARYNPNGSLDGSFSGDGRQMTDFGGSEIANGVALQGNGKIVAVGSGTGDFTLARYNTNGTLDASFSGDGKQTTDFGGLDQATGLALQGDGKIVAVGGTGAPRFGTATADFALARYNANGTLDTSFSGDGRQATDFEHPEESRQDDGAAAVALQADGKIVAVGTTGGFRTSLQFALARYNPDGTLDTSFSGDGKETTGFLGGFQGATGVAIQGDGKIVVVGGGGTGDFALARFNSNGSLDASFSGDGKQTTDFGGGDLAYGVALQGNGRIVAVGSGGGGEDFALARYSPNGSLDPSFSDDGKKRTDFGGGDLAYGVALQENGKIVAVGRGGGGFALARYNPNGALDANFSGDGKQTTDFGGGGQANGVALHANGQIVAAGSGGAGFALARYNPNGTLDANFSGDGKQTTDFGGGDRANGMALQANGKIVAVGVGSGTDNTSDFALARYLGG